jgi:hypothetical protein
VISTDGGGSLFEEVARARATEARALQDRGLLCGAVYMSGYVVECRLKALLRKQGKSFPTSGSAGHNLHALWEAAGLRIDDLRGHKREFIDVWNTRMRYWADLPPGMDGISLLAGARELASMVAVRIRHTRGLKGKRRHG